MPSHAKIVTPIVQPETKSVVLPEVKQAVKPDVTPDTEITREQIIKNLPS